MKVTAEFKEDSARAAIRALRGLEQTAVMLEAYAPEIFPNVDEHGRKDVGRVIMESAAKAIRDAWADAIKDVENAARARQIAASEPVSR